MANYTNNQTGTINNTVNTLPISKTGTGTITSNGNAFIGVGTKFTKELRAGSWIFNGTNEIVRVNFVFDDLLCYVDNAFTTPLTASSFKYVKNLDAQMKNVWVSIKSGLTNGTINGAPLINGIPQEFTKTGNGRSGRKGNVDPVIIDGTGTVVDYAIQY